MIICGLDPGTTHTAMVVFDGTAVLGHNIMPNHELLMFLVDPQRPIDVLATEYMESSLGMAVGRETCTTIFWNGRFVQAWYPKRWVPVTRYNVKCHICGQVRATDSNIRQSLIDRFGPLGTKKQPGILFGIKSHEWAALAVAVTYYDLESGKPEEIRPNVRADF